MIQTMIPAIRTSFQRKCHLYRSTSTSTVDSSATNFQRSTANRSWTRYLSSTTRRWKLPFQWTSVRISAEHLLHRIHHERCTSSMVWSMQYTTLASICPLNSWIRKVSAHEERQFASACGRSQHDETHACKFHIRDDRSPFAIVYSNRYGCGQCYRYTHTDTGWANWKHCGRDDKSGRIQFQCPMRWSIRWGSLSRYYSLFSIAFGTIVLIWEF